MNEDDLGTQYNKLTIPTRVITFTNTVYGIQNRADTRGDISLMLVSLYWKETHTQVGDSNLPNEKHVQLF